MDKAIDFSQPRQLPALRRAVAGLCLAGLASIAAIQPALAGKPPTGHITVTAQVVYHCKIQTSISVRQQAVQVVTRHCSDQPRITTAAFTSVHSRTLPGTLSSEYTLNKVAGRPHSGVQYLEINF